MLFVCSCRGFETRGTPCQPLCDKPCQPLSGKQRTGWGVCLSFVRGRLGGRRMLLRIQPERSSSENSKKKEEKNTKKDNRKNPPLLSRPTTRSCDFSICGLVNFRAGSKKKEYCFSKDCFFTTCLIIFYLLFASCSPHPPTHPQPPSSVECVERSTLGVFDTSLFLWTLLFFFYSLLSIYLPIFVVFGTRCSDCLLGFSSTATPNIKV